MSHSSVLTKPTATPAIITRTLAYRVAMRSPQVDVLLVKLREHLDSLEELPLGSVTSFKCAYDVSIVWPDKADDVIMVSASTCDWGLARHLKMRLESMGYRPTHFTQGYNASVTLLLYRRA